MKTDKSNVRRRLCQRKGLGFRAVPGAAEVPGWENSYLSSPNHLGAVQKLATNA